MNYHVGIVSVGGLSDADRGHVSIIRVGWSEEAEARHVVRRYAYDKYRSAHRARRVEWQLIVAYNPTRLAHGVYEPVTSGMYEPVAG